MRKLRRQILTNANKHLPKKEEIDKYTAPIESLANVQFDHMRLF